MTPRRLAVVGSGVAGLTAANVASRNAEMSLSTSDEATGLERAGALGARGLFPAAVNAWRTVVGGSRSYVDRVAAAIEAAGGSVRSGVAVIEVSERDTSVTVRTATGEEEYYAVFPGGALPSVRAIEETAARRTRLRVMDRASLGTHYDRTFRLWDDAFAASADQVEALGFDETFRRLSHFYLEYSRAGSASGYIDDHQLTLAREDG